MFSGNLRFLLMIAFMLFEQTGDDGVRYSFIAEWFDNESQTLRKFYLMYFTADDTVELFDIKNNNTFLKRTKCEGVSAKDIYIGAIITIFSRQMNITDFADNFTREKFGKTLQKTFGMLKPDVADKYGEILKMIYANDFKITKLKMARLTKEQAQEFYKEHEGKPFLPFLVEFMTSGPVLAMELVAENGIAKWRETIGPTDSEVARTSAPESVRAKYGKDKSYNAVHGSDSVEAAERELSIFFPASSRDLDGKMTPKTTATFKNCTCCVIKPHAVQEGLLGDIIYEIQKSGFRITGMQMFYMDYPNAEEFYEVYKGVVPECTAMVSQLVSGPCVALEIVSDTPDTPSKFRALVGPPEPDRARELRPNTLRAKFGKTKVLNAIHCSDLPEDGLLEVEYFFKILS
ncbi:nucleoside diphosphate kinase 7 isoform X1 [Schistocerca americana]|uniref:nucleoside diphosphate kinase 7 isoform X1 n=1 Tax=Schistocerca americana TaxID=7009 RepID=UPI001F500D90|nr:nucleoside diphosphate kinase 7 isoform X1 [Schistocerca americana]